jgi:ATP-dependent Lon protease
MQKVGQAIGLAWTPSGSHLIQVMAKTKKGTGKIAVSGDIGYSFLESLEVAMNLLVTRFNFCFEKINIEITIPGGLDGPSAGLPLFVAIHSAMTKKPINQNIAFTGALNDEGGVIWVGAIAEKLMAAKRALLHSVIFPMENLAELPQYCDIVPWGNLYLSPVKNVEEALKISLP